MNGLQIMAAVRADVDVAGVGSAHREQTVIGLHDAIAVIAAEAEHTPFPAAGPSRHLDGEPVEYVGVEFSPAMAIRIFSPIPAL